MAEIVVIGGGAAGMMAAIAAAQAGGALVNKVTLLEKMINLEKNCLLREKGVVM